ncbi:CLUMA_CG004940, isoform A [Clunio marinus]|uniref:Dihydrolipoamide acetyltransferase component of pyruvate dehydrogenase complex n=1 Tax=Clunio marinus TaxID=568069 RepID=A0A1J1HV85_9DIPT|nr:CLUMA_CG004940, isoform A [Clunio marinus]
MAQLLRKIGTSIFPRKSFLANSKHLGYSVNFNLRRSFQTSLSLQKLVTFNLSDIGEGIHEVSVKEWFVEVGQVVSQFDNICEVQSDKASVTITSRYDGRIMKLYHSIDDIALVGKPLLDFDIDDEEDENSGSSSDSSSSSEDEKESGSSSDSETSKILTTPSVRRIAKENNVDLNKVHPTGKGGRILKGDVLEYLNLVPKGTQKPHPSLKEREKSEFEVPPPLTSRTVISPLEHRIVRLKGVPKVMYKSMTEALKIPHFSYSEEVDMSKLVSVRDEIKIEAQSRGIKITYMPFFIKALSVCLHKYPILNSSLDVENASIIYKPYHNISIAIHTPMGLVVPNIKNVHEKSILEISNEVMKIHDKGLKGALTPEDFSDGTFTLSNIGIIGGTYTHPVIMPPQVCIVAIGKINVLPRFDADGELVKAHIMKVSFSADHRIIDGVTISSFVNLWKQYLENPNLFLLDGH